MLVTEGNDRGKRVAVETLCQSEQSGGGEATEWFSRHIVPDHHAVCTDPTMASRSEPSEASSRGKGVYGKQKFLRMDGYAKIRSILQPPYEQDHNYSICPYQNEYGNQMWSSNTIVPHSVHDGWTVRNKASGSCIPCSYPLDVHYALSLVMSY